MRRCLALKCHRQSSLTKSYPQFPALCSGLLSLWCSYVRMSCAGYDSSESCMEHSCFLLLPLQRTQAVEPVL